MATASESKPQTAGEDAMEIENPLYDEAVELAETSPEKALPKFRSVIFQEDPENEQVKLREASIYHIGKIYAKLGKAAELRALIVELRPFFEQVSKAKTAKIGR